MEITSLSNQKVKEWAKLKEKKYRDRSGLFIVEGEHLVEEAYEANILTCIVKRKDYQSTQNFEVETYEVTEEIMQKLTTVLSGEPILGIAKIEQKELCSNHKLILLDNVQDPGNAGTILRSAYAFGYEGVVFSNTSVDVYNEKVIRSSQGAMFHIPIYRGDLKDIIAQLRAQGTHVYVTSLNDAKPLSSIQPSSSYALVFGNEGQGVSEEILALADTSIIIEMKGFESLNVAIAASICMYEFMEK